jgi:hypothetical protein
MSNDLMQTLPYSEGRAVTEQRHRYVWSKCRQN